MQTKLFIILLSTLFIANSAAKEVDSNLNQAKMTTVNVSSGRHKAVSNFHPDVEIFDVDIALRNDRDGDGYFSNLKVTFDADTHYSEYWLYAELVLSDGISDFHYHTTADFPIYGQASYDSMTIESDLTAGFASDYYELSLWLYDAHTHELLSVLDTANYFNNEGLYLESLEYDQPQIYPAPITPIVHSREYGGGLATLLLIMTLLFGYRKIKDNP